MYFVRVAFPEEDVEQVMALAFAGAEPAGVDEGVLASGRWEYYVYYDSRTVAEEVALALGSCAAGAYEASVEVADSDRDWNETWQRQWQPAAVGARWWLTPAGYAGETPAGRTRLDYHAGLAFGNGDHPTTQLCLEWMEELVRPGDTVLDLGCGSGLLCEAAAALGAVGIGCDLDGAAVAQAGGRGSRVFLGSVDAVGPVDVVVANLALGVLERLMPEIRRVARREVVVSGLLDEQASAFTGERKARDGWVAVRLAVRLPAMVG